MNEQTVFFPRYLTCYRQPVYADRVEMSQELFIQSRIGKIPIR
jgi:hypothetical protein